jgi:alkylation response protein AidB-like acyl-CoA dehydrogenase
VHRGQRRRTPDARDTLYISVPATAAGFSISGDWDPLGMRGTVSRNLHFKDVFVSDDEQLMPRGIYFKGAQTWPAMFFTLSPTYLGLANAAYDFTVQYLRGEVPGEPPVKRRMYPTKQIAVAQMRIQLESMRACSPAPFWRPSPTRPRTKRCACTPRTTASWKAPTTSRAWPSAPAAARA